MKLTTRYNLSALPVSLLFLLFSSVVYYFTVNYILTKQLERELILEEQELQKYVEIYGLLPKSFEFPNFKVELKRTTASADRHFSDTVYWNSIEKEFERGRSLITPLTVDGLPYTAFITKSKVEKEDLLATIIPITFAITCFSILALWITSNIVIRRLWDPFYSILNYLRSYKISDQKQLGDIRIGIDEFDALNKSVREMSANAFKDYQTLKTFTENAAHELMTPIAVIQGKLDTLMQTESISHIQAILVEDLYRAVSRLSRLNQSLLLLVKIESNLLLVKETIEMSTLVENKVSEFSELLEAKSIFYEMDLSPTSVNGSSYLIDILINNLFSNAIRHTTENGNIKIVLKKDSLHIINSAAGNSPLSDQIFQRFYKEESSEGSGLGLAISFQICEVHDWNLSYNLESSNHVFTVSFSPVSTPDFSI
ncbi:MAG: HAMP domain-containing sensor histidine kinase [Bacteroidota bacterium]